MVPIIPTFFPAASRIAFIMWVAVVFPLVPVTPTEIIRRMGLPKRRADIIARAWREFLTFTTATPSGSSVSRSTTKAFTPWAATSAINPWESMRLPFMHTKIVPGTAFRES